MAGEYEIYGATGFIGGAKGDLDNVPTATLDADDRGQVMTTTTWTPYRVNTTVGGAENSPWIIQPDDEGGDKRWQMISALATGLELSVASGDPKVVFDIAGTDEFTIGVDDDDGDKLKIDIGGAVGGSTVMTIDPATGFVGIGTATPIRPVSIENTVRRMLYLHNSGNSAALIKFTNFDSGTADGDGFDIGLSDTEEAQIRNYGNTDLSLWTNGTERVTIANDGEVGINETSPSDLLHIDGGNNNGLRISGPTNPTLTFFENAKGDANIVADIRWDALDSGDANQEYGRIRLIAKLDNAGAEEGSIQFRLADGAGGFANTVIFNGGGNVGIGTAAPATLLHMYSAANAANILSIDITGLGNAETSELNLLSDGTGAAALGGAPTKGWGMITYSNAHATAALRNDLAFRYWNGSGWLDVLYLQNNGDVGINDISPSYLLDVNGTGRYTGNLLLDSYLGIGATALYHLYMNISRDGNYAAYIKNTHATAGHGLSVRAGDSSAESILNLCDKDDTQRFVFWADGTTFGFSPDIRKQTDIEKPTPDDYLDWALSDAKKPLKPYKGPWNGEEALQHEIISERDEGDKYGKDWIKMSMGAVLWAEQARMSINQHELEITDLKESIVEHEQRIAELEGTAM